MSFVYSSWSRRFACVSAAAAAVLLAGWPVTSVLARQQGSPPPAQQGGRGQGAPGGPGRGQGRGPDFDTQMQAQTKTDATWRAASDGYMSMQKTTYQSSAESLEFPVFIFKPLKLRGPKEHAALVWVHPDIRGHVYEYYIPYIREAVARGYVVIAPEYRGSVGYGQEFYYRSD